MLLGAVLAVGAMSKSATKLKEPIPMVMFRRKHIPGPKAGLNEQIRRWRLDFRLSLVVISELIALAVLVAITPVLWWAAVLIVIAALLLVTLSYNGATAWGWPGPRRALSLLPTQREGAACGGRGIPAAFTVDMPGAGAVGMRWDGQYAITMIALHGKGICADGRWCACGCRRNSTDLVSCAGCYRSASSVRRPGAAFGGHRVQRALESGF
ncbi:hypothetical protein [Mycobacterium sp. SMC-8]|uniref:hypothetical protein n=1 Tax=Mycobacterium sp. SMC-8 TaxID=2857060 RepID=UPI0021B298DB|nr:hypothetical protein [Mycobacterium sp. SMC-8]